MYRYRCGQCGNEIIATDDKIGSACPHCGVALSNLDSGSVLPAGYRIGGFEIVRMVGRGSSGNVYQANQLSMGRSIALKVLFSNLTQDRAVTAQFFEEVKILGQIQHPNIVCAYEAGYDQGLYFLAMQYIAGTTLEEYLSKTGPMKVDTALAIIGHVAQALQYVWNKYHFCHRDIKPGNIMIDEDGTPMLLDFGTALRLGEDSIRNGMIEGSPSYMSPEQACGRSLNFASDMYSLGATLYHMLTGNPPYVDPDINKVLQMHCSAPVPTIPDIPVPVQSLLSKMLAKTPEERFGSWEDFLTALAAAQKPAKKKETSTAVRKKTYPANKRTTSVPQAVTAPAPVKKKGLSAITVVFHLVSIAVALVIGGFIYGNRNDNAALDELENAKKMYQKVVDKGADPDRAVLAFRRAEKCIGKFGVTEKTAAEIKQVCEECLADLDSLVQENKDAIEFHQLIISKIRIAEDAAVHAQKLKSNGRDFSSVLDSPYKTMENCAKVLKRTQYRVKLNQERLEQDLSLVNKTRLEIEKIRGAYKEIQRETADSAAASAAEELVEKHRQAEEEFRLVSVEEQKYREEQIQKDSAAGKKSLAKYQALLEKERVKMMRSLIISVKKLDLDAAAAVLEMPDSLKTDDPELQEAQKQLDPVIQRLQEILKTAHPVLSRISGSEDRKELITGKTKKASEQQYCALFLCGYFPEAKQMMPEKDAELFDDVAAAYLRYRLSRAASKAKKGQNGELNALRQDYSKFELYRKLEKEFRVKN